MACHVATRPTVNLTVNWRSTTVDRWSGGGLRCWQATWHQSQGDTWHSNHEVRGTIAAGTRLKGLVRGAGGQISVQCSEKGQYKVSILEASRWTSGMI
ncbi:hypothetical protein Tco_0422038 [Tanacetum coccineum]